MGGSMIDLTVDGQTVKAYHTAGEGDGLPGVVVLMEWWGLNDHIKDVCERFAVEGFAVVAPDLYSSQGNAVTEDADEAAKLMGNLTTDQVMKEVQAAVDYLGSQGNVNPDKRLVMGFCMGGLYTLFSAALVNDIKTVVSYYGMVKPVYKLMADFKVPVMYFYGDKDKFVTLLESTQLRKVIKKTGEMIVYYGKGHAFFNDTRPDTYDEKSAKDSWKKMMEYIKKQW